MSNEGSFVDKMKAKGSELLEEVKKINWKDLINKVEEKVKTIKWEEVGSFFSKLDTMAKVSVVLFVLHAFSLLFCSWFVQTAALSILTLLFLHFANLKNGKYAQEARTFKDSHEILKYLVLVIPTLGFLIAKKGEIFYQVVSNQVAHSLFLYKLFYVIYEYALDDIKGLFA